MQSTVTVLLIVVAMVVGCYSEIPIKSCDSATDISVTDIKVYNSTWSCQTAPCPLVRGKNITITIDFKNGGKDSIPSLSNSVYGLIGPIPVPFPGYPDDEVDVCKLGVNNTKCPIAPGASFTEKVVLPVLKNAPAMKVVAKWEFKTADKKEIGCFEVYLQLV